MNRTSSGQLCENLSETDMLWELQVQLLLDQLRRRTEEALIERATVRP